MKIFVIALALILASCSTQSNPRVASIQNLATVCHSTASVINTLAAYRSAGRLSPAQVTMVLEMEPVASQMCDPNSPPVDTVTALNKVSAILAQLSAMAAHPAKG